MATFGGTINVPMVDEPDMERSTEEMDQIHRRVKKYKRPASRDPAVSRDQGMQSGPAWADLLRPPFLTNPFHRDDLYTREAEEDDDFMLSQPSKGTESMDENSVMAGRISIEVSTEECKELWQPWHMALVVKLLGRNVSYRVLSQRLSDMWTQNRRLDIVDIEDGFYVVRFLRKEDYTYVLENGPWAIQGHYLTVSKLRPGFLPSRDNITSTLVWVRIPRLPLEFFNENMLMRIGDQLGTTVKIDMQTMTVSRGKYARVCVKIAPTSIIFTTPV